MAEPLNLTELQARQEAYDAGFWEHEPGDPTLEHTLSHLAKLLGKLGTYVEAAQHGEHPDNEVVVHEVIPDLVIFAARLANSAVEGKHYDLGTLVETRERTLRRRFAGENPTS